jgi:Xaa-Pro aminopeptidase
MTAAYPRTEGLLDSERGFMDTIDRLKRAEDEVARQGLAALVVFGWGSALGQSTRSHGHMRYLTGWDSQRFQSVLVLVAKNKPRLFVSNQGAALTAQETIQFCDVKFSAPINLGAALGEYLQKNLDVSASRIGIVGRSEMPIGLWEKLAIPEGMWTDFTPVLDEWRVIKDASQIERHRVSASVCDHLFANLPRLLHSGANLFAIRAILQAEAAGRGAEYCDLWLTVAKNAQRELLFKVDMQHVPEEGDQVLCGIALTVDGYWGHAIRSGNMGRASDQHAFFFESLRKIYDIALSELKPGKDLAELDLNMKQALAIAFPNFDDTSVFSRFRYAHGLGFSYEDPIVSDAFPQPYLPGAQAKSVHARPGMIIEIHPNLFHATQGGAALGDMVLVTETGCEALTRFPLNFAIY